MVGHRIRRGHRLCSGSPLCLLQTTLPMARLRRKGNISRREAVRSLLSEGPIREFRPSKHKGPRDPIMYRALLAVRSIVNKAYWTKPVLR